ncbi:hypothetical protein V6N13_018466 [Hibiscus sabdariffa]
MTGGKVGSFEGRIRAAVGAVSWDERGYSYTWSLVSSGGRVDEVELRWGSVVAGWGCFLCGKDWTLVFSKVDLRNNKVADRLAKLASAVSLDVVTFDEPPSEVVLDIG